MHEEAVARRLVQAITKRTARHTTFALIRQRASRFFPIIEPYLARYHIPADFKYLPLVESALNGTAMSVKGAGGYWQLMPDTARELGLTVSPQLDERFDLHKSTDAACQYLRLLHNRFGSWTLTAAAYNLGMGRLLANIRRQQMWNYYYLRLNAETGQYLYRILAFKTLFAPQRTNNPADPTELVLPDNNRPLLVDTDMDQLIRQADAQTAPADSVAGQSVGVTLPNAAAVVAGGIRTRLAEAGRAERGQRWVFQLLGDNPINKAVADTGDMLYAVVEDVDVQTGKVYLRADRVYSSSDRRSYPLALGAIDPRSGRLGVPLPDQATPSAGWVTIWKVL